MKTRKLLSLLLVAALAVTLFTVPAMAEDDVITLTGSIFLESIESSPIKHDPVSNYIRDRFGVQFEVICDCAGSTWEERYPALWETLLELTERHEVRCHWVRGHAENEYNNRCDALAVKEREKFQ